MTIEFILLVNKQGQTRLAQYSSFLSIAERSALEGEVVRKCLQRRDTDCNFVEHLRYKLIYRRYASLFFIVGVNNSDAEDPRHEGELAMFEFIHLLVETFDRYFENVCELDVMFNVEKAHFILEEMMTNGGVGETNKLLILQPVLMMDKEPRKV